MKTGPRKSRKVASKICVKCGEVKPLTAFYPHKDWHAQSSHDAWCKDCCQAFCVNAETLKEYCWYNNRRYADAQYNAARKKAMYSLANHPEYLRANISREKKEQLEAECTCRQFFSLMNLPNFYVYTDNISDEGGVAEYDPNKLGTEAMGEDEPLHYSQAWNGMYTQRDIDYLDRYYAQLEDDFVLDNENIRDYARKVSKASLDADLTYNKMRHGQATVGAWKEAQAIFDNLSKSANFAACKRKPGENAGLGALGLIIQKIEGTGALQTVKVSFPKDDVDRIIADFRHTVGAVGLENLGG